MRAICVAIVLLIGSASAALAGECPMLQAQVDKAVGARFDGSAARAKALAKEAMDLHRAGKHADSVKKYDEAAMAAGLKLQHKK
jgi:hypothetical protein